MKIKTLATTIALLTNTAALANKVEVLPENSLALRGEVTEQSISVLSLQIAKLQGKPFTLVINSPGGSVFAGMKLVDTIQHYPSKVTCIVDIAASMAFVITQACHERITTPSGILMQHFASYGVQGSEANLLSFQGLISTILKRMDNMQSARIGITYDDFRKKLQGDWWIYGADNLTENTVDRIGNFTCTPTMLEGTTEEILNVLMFRIKLTWSACPLISYPMKVELVNENKTEPTQADKEKAKQLIDHTLNFRARINDFKKINN